MTRTTFATAAALSLAVSITPTTGSAHDDYVLKDPAVYDGDTLRAEPRNLRLTQRGGAPYDTPEIGQHSGCREEQLMGTVARERLRSLMAGGFEVHVLPGTAWPDRGLAWIELADGRDAGAVLIAEGLAMESRNFDWCALLETI